MDLRIDPEFEQLIYPLTPEERQQLEANLLADGCRDPLSVWPTADGPPILLDGHNRYAICTAHNLPFDVTAIGLDMRDDALRWIINNQLGRRNLEPLQRDTLIGRRYELEKRAEGRPEKLGENPLVSGPTSERLAKEYQVDESTIRENGQFVQALDELKKIREDLPRSITTKRSRPQTRGKTGAGPRVTKARVISVGKLIKDKQVTPPPFMRRGEWQDFQILEGLSLLAKIPLEEHPEITALFTTPPMPPALGVQVLKNLLARGSDGRQMIYRLFASPDSRERSLAQTLAAEMAPMPDPQGTTAERMLVDLERLRDRLGVWVKEYPQEPWSAKLREMQMDLKAMCAGLRQLKENIRTAHQERIAPYAQTLLTTGRGTPLS